MIEHFFFIFIGHLLLNECLTHYVLIKLSFSSGMPHVSIKFLLMLGGFLDFTFCSINQTANSFSSCSL